MPVRFSVALVVGGTIRAADDIGVKEPKSPRTIKHVILVLGQTLSMVGVGTYAVCQRYLVSRQVLWPDWYQRYGGWFHGLQ